MKVLFEFERRMASVHRKARGFSFLFFSKIYVCLLSLRSFCFFFFSGCDCQIKRENMVLLFLFLCFFFSQRKTPFYFLENAFLFPSMKLSFLRQRTERSYLCSFFCCCCCFFFWKWRIPSFLFEDEGFSNFSKRKIFSFEPLKGFLRFSYQSFWKELCCLRRNIPLRVHGLAVLVQRLFAHRGKMEPKL